MSLTTKRIADPTTKVFLPAGQFNERNWNGLTAKYYIRMLSAEQGGLLREEDDPLDAQFLSIRKLSSHAQLDTLLGNSQLDAHSEDDRTTGAIDEVSSHNEDFSQNVLSSTDTESESDQGNNNQSTHSSPSSKSTNPDVHQFIRGISALNPGGRISRSRSRQWRLTDTTK